MRLPSQKLVFVEERSLAMELLWRILFATAVFPTSGALRRLEDNAYFEYDLSDFSLRFEKCQFVKMYDDEIAQDADSASPLALKNFIVFKLCDDCSTCDVYGTYVLEVEEYLGYTLENQRQEFEAMCENCNEECNGDDDECTGCGKSCSEYQNMEENGLIDASEYIECQLWQPEGDDDGQPYYYIGPRCDSGNSITIGVFSDQNCWEPVEDVSVEDLLGGTLSYHLLRHTYSSTDQVCLSCEEGEYAADDDRDNADEDNVNEMCEEVYAKAAKCESKTGLENGFIQVNREEEDYENQVENEFMACTFINSLLWDSYTETGEINWKAKQDVILREVTHKQTIVLALFVLVFSGLFGLMYYYDQKIQSIENKPLVGRKTGSYA